MHGDRDAGDRLGASAPGRPGGGGGHRDGGGALAGSTLRAAAVGDARDQVGHGGPHALGVRVGLGVVAAEGELDADVVRDVERGAPAATRSLFAIDAPTSLDAIFDTSVPVANSRAPASMGSGASTVH